MIIFNYMIVIFCSGTQQRNTDTSVETSENSSSTLGIGQQHTKVHRGTLAYRNKPVPACLSLCKVSLSQSCHFSIPGLLSCSFCLTLTPKASHPNPSLFIKPDLVCLLGVLSESAPDIYSLAFHAQAYFSQSIFHLSLEVVFVLCFN